MSKIVEVDATKAADVDGLVKDLTDAVTQPAPAQTPAKEPTATRPSYIEEKYWDGDVESSLQKQHEGFKSLQNRYGQMANDLGQQRKLADELIGIKRQNDLGAETLKPRPKLTTSALLEKPEASLDEWFSEKQKQLQAQYDSRIASLESQLLGNRIEQEHPGYQDLMNDEGWHEWLQSDPYRAKLANYAAQGDVDIATRLIDEYKKGSKPSQNATPPAGESPKADLSKVTKTALETAASGDTGTGKIYSRTALMMLKQRNPDVYEDPAFQAEILKAYQEKRVR